MLTTQMAKNACSNTVSAIHDQFINSTKALSMSFASIVFYLPIALSSSRRTEKTQSNHIPLTIPMLMHIIFRFYNYLIE